MDKTQLLQILTLGREKVAAGWTTDVFGLVGQLDSLEHHLFQADAVCAVGGIVYGAEEVCSDPFIEATDEEMPFEAIAALFDALPPGAPVSLRDKSNVFYLHNQFEVDAIAIWNDEPGRTQEEVLELYDRAIAQVERTLHVDQEATATGA